MKQPEQRSSIQYSTRSLRLEFDLFLFIDLQIQIAQLEMEGLDWIGLD